MSPEPKTPYLMLTELFLPTKGGTAVSFDDDFRRLGGKEVHVVTADVPGGREFDRSHPNTVHRLKLARVPWVRPESLLMYAKFLGKALQLVATNRFDAIFAGRALPEGLVALLVGRLIGRPVLIYAHGEELTGWGRGWKFKAMSLILSVGRLMRRKGFDNVIRVLPRLVAQGIDGHYAVIGIGEERGYLQGLVDELGLADRVHLLGHVPYEDLPRWYCACSLFAMPNRDIGGDTEGFGLVFLEAASAARPALAGTAGGTGSAVVDGMTGLRVDGESLEAIAEGLARLLTNAVEAERMGLQGRERVLDFYTHQRRVDQLRSLVRRGRYRPRSNAERRDTGEAPTTR